MQQSVCIRALLQGNILLAAPLLSLAADKPIPYPYPPHVYERVVYRMLEASGEHLHPPLRSLPPPLLFETSRRWIRDALTQNGKIDRGSFAGEEMYDPQGECGLPTIYVARERTLPLSRLVAHGIAHYLLGHYQRTGYGATAPPEEEMAESVEWKFEKLRPILDAYFPEPREKMSPRHERCK